MSLLGKLTEGQDVEVRINKRGPFKKLRVIYSLFDKNLIFFADRGKYINDKQKKEHPNIDTYFLSYEGYGFDSQKRIVSLNNIHTEYHKSILKPNKRGYDNVRQILENWMFMFLKDFSYIIGRVLFFTNK